LAAHKGNSYWMLANPKNIGRKLSLKYDDVKARIEDYFRLCIKHSKDKDGMRPTITGLALHAGFNDRKQMAEYVRHDEFRNLIKKARGFVENYYESQLSKQHNVGAIFALKQMGWADKVEVDQNTHGVQEVIVTLTKDGKQHRLKDGKMVELGK